MNSNRQKKKEKKKKEKKQFKIQSPYFLLLLLTYLIFMGVHFSEKINIHIPKEIRRGIEDVMSGEFVNRQENNPYGVFPEQIDNSKDTLSANSVSGNSVSGNSVSGNGVSGNGAGDVSGNQLLLPARDKVSEEYLKDALFIGDSRTSTLYEYAGWKDATFFVKNGLSIWDVMEEKIAVCEGENVSVEEALEREKFGKIYIMLGVNELGRGTAETFSKQYKQVVMRIKELQPDAAVIMQAIMHVTKSKDEEETYINNIEINARNEKLKAVAAELGVYWLDVNEVTDDGETGCLTEEYTFDGVHLKVKFLDVWKDFLLEHPYCSEE